MPIYNVPTTWINKYPDQYLVIRSANAGELIETAASVPAEKIVSLQLLSLDTDSELLVKMKNNLPVDLVLSDDPSEFPRLYQYTDLMKSRPVRVTMPLFPGFTRTLKLASALGFHIKLDVRQPEGPLAEELLEMASYFLHTSTVYQPVEFFHSTFMSYFHNMNTTLWAVQEEDPAYYRYITNDGQETWGPRVTASNFTGDVDNFLDEVKFALLSSKAECATCAFFSPCHGFFKYPRREFSCGTLKKIFQTLRDASQEMKRDLAGYDKMEGSVEP